MCSSTQRPPGGTALSVRTFRLSTRRNSFWWDPEIPRKVSFDLSFKIDLDSTLRLRLRTAPIQEWKWFDSEWLLSPIRTHFLNLQSLSRIVYANKSVRRKGISATSNSIAAFCV